MECFFCSIVMKTSIFTLKTLIHLFKTNEYAVVISFEVLYIYRRYSAKRKNSHMKRMTKLYENIKKTKELKKRYKGKLSR